MKQHLISQALLRRFVDDSKRLCSFDIEHAWARLRYPAEVAWKPRFIAHEAAAAEALWKEVEDNLTPALDAVERGTVFEAPGAAQTLKDAIALHFMRRVVVKEKADALVDKVRDNLVIPDKFKQHEKLIWTEFERERPVVISENLRSLFLRARRDASEGSLEIYESTAPLLIGDGAVLSMKKGRIGFAAFQEAGTHLLPVGRHHLVALGGENRTSTLPDHLVVEFNRHQILNSASHVFFHPEDDLGDFVAKVRDA